MLFKSIGRDEPCPWGKLLRYPWAVARFVRLQEEYTRRLSILKMTEFFRSSGSPLLPARSWIKRDGTLLTGQSLLAYVLAEEDWISSEAPSHRVRPGDIVVDIGAHIGSFGDAALRRELDGSSWLNRTRSTSSASAATLQAKSLAGRVVVVPEGAWSAASDIGFQPRCRKFRNRQFCDSGTQRSKDKGQSAAA